MLKGMSRLALLLCVSLLAAPAWAGSTFSVTFAGTTSQFTSSQGTFSASGNQTGLTVTYHDSNDDFDELQIQAPANQNLAAGIYDDAQDTSFAGPLQPGLTVLTGGSDCEAIPSRFIIRSITWNGSTLQSLAVDFQQNCSNTAGPITGSLRYNDPTPIPFPTPTADAGSSQSVLQEALVTLDGSQSDGGAGTITAYAWTQTAGQSVSLSGANTAKPSFTAPDVDLGGSNPDLTFQLEVTSNTTATPDTSVATVTVHVRNPADPVTSLTLTGDPSSTQLGGKTLNFDPTDALFTTTKLAAGGKLGPGVQFTVNGGRNAGQSWTLQFAAPEGLTLQPGTVYDLVQAYPSESATAPGMNVGSGCTTLDGRFVVLDFQTDGQGNVTAFAADFEQHCGGELPALRGKIRYNSAAPLTEPFASAGAPQILEQGSTVTLSAAGSDAGGGGESISSYQWSQVSGPGVTLSDATAASPSFTAPAVSAGGADLVFKVTITNSDGLTSTDTVTVHIAAPGDPMTLFYAASDPGDSVGKGAVTSFTSLQADFLADPPVSTPFHGVQFLVQPPGLEEWFVYFSMPGTQALQTGTYTFATPYPDGGKAQTLPGMSVWEPIRSCTTITGNFTVLDVQVTSNTITSFAADFEEHCLGAIPGLRGKIRYNSTVQADDPLAEAGQLQRVTQGATVGLSAAGSDPGATGVTLTGYQWTQLSGASATLSDPTLPDPSFTAPAVPLGGSDLVFQLTVTNSLGLTGSTQVTVHVMNPADPPFLTALHVDSDKGDVVGGGQITDIDTSTHTFGQSILSNGLPGVHELDVDIEPIDFNSADIWDLVFTAPQTQALQAGNTYDLVQQDPIQSPVLPGIRVEAIGFQGCDIDPAHFAVLDLQQDPYGTVVSAAFDFEQHCTGATGSLHGKYRYNSDVPMDAPFADAGPAQIVLQEATVQLTGHNSYTGSPTDTISSYQWTQLSGPSVTLSDPTLADPTFSAPDVAAGGADLSFQLGVVNSESLSGSDTVKIHVSNPADPVTRVRIVSDPDDPADQGRTVQLDSLTAAFTALKLTNANGHLLEMTVNGGSAGGTTIDLAPPSGQTLQAGTEYRNATAYDFTTSANPEISVDCVDNGSGEFIIRDIQVAGDGTLLSLAADFLQHCQGSPAALRGKIRYNSSYPFDDPVADPGSEQAVQQGDTVTLSGAATDAGGDGNTITSWQWTQIDNGAPSVELTGADTQTATFIPSDVPAGGETLEFQLTVTNSLGLTSVEDVTVLVANPADPQTGFYLSGSADGETTVQSLVRQPIDGGSFSITTASTKAVTVTYTAPDESEWHMTFVPPAGQSLHTGIYTGVTATAAPPGHSPEMLVSPSDFSNCSTINGQFTVRDIQFDGSGNVTALAVDFKQGCDPNPDTIYPVLRGKLRYNSAVTLREPTADAGFDQLIYSGFPVTLDGSASSTAFGTITGYSWTQLVGKGDPVVTLTNAATAKPSFNTPTVPLGGRTLAFQLTTTNSLGFTHQDVVDVTVGNEDDRKTVFYYQSDADDPDGHGATVLALPVDVFIELLNANAGGVDFDFIPNGTTAFDQIWELTFDASNGQVPMHTGVYPVGPDLDFTGMIATDGGCDQTGGAFVVRDVGFDKAGHIASLGVDFVRHCLGAVGDLRGAFRYNSPTPIQVAQPTASAGLDQVVTAPGPVTLDGSNSFPGWTGPVRYQWTQLGGPTVQLLNRTKAVASFVLPETAMSTKGTPLVFQLTVSNSSGQASSSQVTVTGKLQFTALLSFQSDAGDPIGQGRSAAYFLQDGALTVQKGMDNSLRASMSSNGYWVLDFAAKNKQPLKVGTYDGATLYRLVGTPVPGLSVAAGGRRCNSVSGDFTVRDVQYVGSAVSSLAVDFDQFCDGSSAGLHGKLRYHSSVP